MAASLPVVATVMTVAQTASKALEPEDQAGRAQESPPRSHAGATDRP